MTPWKLYLYSPQSGLNPVRDWYEEQSDEVRAEFDVAIQFFRANDNWEEAFETRALTGRFLGLQEIMVTVDLEDGEHQFGVIGKWRADSCQFVLFNVCDRYRDEYQHCLELALEYAQAWERKDPKGQIDEYALE